MVWWLYNLLLTFSAPLWVPWMMWRAYQRQEKPNWKERYGDFAILPDKTKRRLWLHAVSVGEVVAAMPVLRELRRMEPESEIVLSVTTSSGHQTARERATGLYDHLVYFPIDVARFQLAGMSRVRPAVVLIMETELWMNFLWAAKTFRARTVLVNGRVSERSFKRMAPVRWFYRAMLRDLDLALMQTPEDVQRIQAMGASHAESLGNCKFDQAAEAFEESPSEVRHMLGIPESAPVVVIGSTRSDLEEDFVLDAMAQLDVAGLHVVHAPRHLERSEALAEKVRSRFGEVALRSNGERGRYLVLDTYGELGKAYAIADVAVVGGGFDRLGGQNLIQPLALGIPTLHGPHMSNFRTVAEQALACGATRVCETPAELAQSLRELLGDETLRKQMGDAARELVGRNLGASQRMAERALGA